MHGGQRAYRYRVCRYEEVVLNDDDGSGLAGIHPTCSGDNVTTSRSRHLLFAPRCAYGLDEVLIIGLGRGSRDCLGLATGLDSEVVSSNIRHPDLHRSKTLRTKALAMRGNSIPNSHAPMLHVTCNMARAIREWPDHRDLVHLVLSTRASGPASRHLFTRAPCLVDV